MRLYYGTYGHHSSGKLYVYWGDDNLRTGEQVVAPVTNKRTGRTYDTMFTIARALNVKNAQNEVQRLDNSGIFIKTIGGRNVLALPGGKDYETKISWKRDSNRRYESEKRRRLGLPPLGTGSQRTAETPRKPSPHSVNPQYVKRVKEEQNQLSKAIRRIKPNKAETRDAANAKAKAALKQRQQVSNTVRQRQRLINMRRR